MERIPVMVTGPGASCAVEWTEAQRRRTGAGGSFKRPTTCQGMHKGARPEPRALVKDPPDPKLVLRLLLLLLLEQHCRNRRAHAAERRRLVACSFLLSGELVQFRLE